jgi:hypothetical protein
MILDRATGTPGPFNATLDRDAPMMVGRPGREGGIAQLGGLGDDSGPKGRMDIR